MSAMADECRLFFYEEIVLLKGNRPFWLVRHKQTEKYYVKKKLSSANYEVYKSLMRVASPHVPKIYECISIDDECIVIEEYINGDTLAVLKEQGRINDHDTIGIMINLCDVLAMLHSMNPPIIHKDIKAENIMLTNDGVVKLMDFDIARFYDKERNQDTQYMGTVNYAAPEHFGFGQTDARSDIYSCGVLLNYLLTGKMPNEQMADGWMGKIVEKCIQIDPAHRYQNASELQRDLMQKNVTTTNKYRKFLPPGFRTMTPWKMLVAGISYLSMFQITLELELQEAGSVAENTLYQIFSGLGMLSGVFVLFNYLGLTDCLPGARRSDGSISWGKRWLYAFLSFILMLVFAVILADFPVFT